MVQDKYFQIRYDDLLDARLKAAKDYLGIPITSIIKQAINESLNEVEAKMQRTAKIAGPEQEI